jgi:hypothetical protein
MKFIDYKRLLEKNNIILFDHDYRISYYNINNFNNLKSNNNMIGGGDYNSFVINLLKEKNTNDLRSIVQMSLSSNPLYLFNYI